METWISQIDQQLVYSASDPDAHSYREAETLPEPESWQLEDFEDIVPHDLGEFETEYDSTTTHCL